MNSIEYTVDEHGTIHLPQGAPFNGEPVLIKFSSGWCEAYWEPGSISETQNGKEYEGWCWICMDDQFQQELDDAQGWMELPT